MARLALLAVLGLALLVSPTLAYVKANGQADVETIMQCLRQRGQHKTFLKLFESSGFSAIVARYVTSQPVSLLVPTDAAFASLPARIRARIKGAVAIKLLEYHMMLHMFPADYLRMCLPTAFFDSVLGDYIYKAAAADKKTILLSSKKRAEPSSTALVVKPDACGLRTRTIAVHVINNVLIPGNMLTTETH